MDKATEFMIDSLEGKMGMKVSRDSDMKKGKTVAVASSLAVGRAIASRMKRKGIGAQQKVKNLGVDFAAGGTKKKGANDNTMIRYKEAIRKQARAMRLGRKLAPSINRTAIVASITYGVASSGVTDEQLGKQEEWRQELTGPQVAARSRPGYSWKGRTHCT